MKLISAKAEFECLNERYQYIIEILIDTQADVLRFHFISSFSDKERVPVPAREFDVITTFHRKVLFNRLPQSAHALQEGIRECVNEYLRNFKHPDLPSIDYGLTD